MGILIGQRDTSDLLHPAPWLIECLGGGAETASGVRVTQSSALKYTPFWAAVRVISGTIASLPFIAYRRLLGGGKERVPGHPVYNLLHNRPNEYIDAISLIETRQAHALCYGNGYCEIQRDGGGRPVALWPLLPNKTRRRIKDGIPYYEIDVLTGKEVNLPDYNVLHIKGLGFDGYTGYDVVDYHREAIGYGMAAKEYGSRFFGNSANPGGVLEHPNQLSDKAKKYLAESWKLESGGLSQAHRFRILEEGMKWHATGVEPEKAQAIETQKFTVDDCSRIFNIPPHKIGSLERATFSNIEEQNIDFVAFTMFYWFRKWEQECNYKLFMPSEQKSMFCEILVDAILRGKIQDRYASYSQGRQWGWLCVDDIREFENMNPLPNGQGKIYLTPANMMPADQAGKEPKPAPAPDGGDDVGNAHFKLIEEQWTRIINKHLGLLQNSPKEYSYVKMQKYAETVMIGAVHAFASMHGRTREEVKVVLNTVIRENINSDTKLQPEDAARLTKMIIENFNGDGNHAIAKT